jgi:hypothetical protein
MQSPLFYSQLSFVLTFILSYSLTAPSSQQTLILTVIRYHSLAASSFHPLLVLILMYFHSNEAHLTTAGSGNNRHHVPSTRRFSFTPIYRIDCCHIPCTRRSILKTAPCINCHHAPFACPSVSIARFCSDRHHVPLTRHYSRVDCHHVYHSPLLHHN